MVTKSKNYVVAPLDPSLTPAATSTQLINQHLDAFVARGNPQKSVNLAMSVASPFISALKSGEQLIPMSRLLEFADILGLSHEDRVELIHTRLVEQHGRNGDFSLHVIAEWALELARPTGDHAVLCSMWDEECEIAPHMLARLLSNPKAATRVRAAMQAAIQDELQEQAMLAHAG